MVTSYTLGQYDDWIINECESLTPTQWKRLTNVAFDHRQDVQLLAGDARQFRSREDDCGVDASGFPTDAVELEEQIRFYEHSAFCKDCLKWRTLYPTELYIDILCHRRIICDGSTNMLNME